MTWQRTKAATPPVRAAKVDGRPKRVDAADAITSLRDAATATRLTGMRANVSGEDLAALADLIERLSNGLGSEA